MAHVQSHGDNRICPYIPSRDPPDVCQAAGPPAAKHCPRRTLPPRPQELVGLATAPWAPSPWLLGRLFMKDLTTGTMRVKSGCTSRLAPNTLHQESALMSSANQIRANRFRILPDANADDLFRSRALFVVVATVYTASRPAP